MDRISWILSHIHSADRVLNVGCCGMEDVWPRGMRLHLELEKRVGARRLMGLDINSNLVERMRLDGHMALVGDAEEIGALCHAFQPDVIVAGEIIEHLPNPGVFLEGARRILCPGGKLLLTTPNVWGFWTVYTYWLRRREERNSEHVAWYSARWLANLLERHGWRGPMEYAGPDPGPRRCKWLKAAPERIPCLRPHLVVAAQPK